EADLREGEALTLREFDHFSGNGQAHGSSGLPRYRSAREEALRGHGRLTERESAVVLGNLPRAEHAEAGRLQPFLGALEEEAILETSAAEHHRVHAALGAGQVATGLDGTGHGFVEAGGGDRVRGAGGDV